MTQELIRSWLPSPRTRNPQLWCPKSEVERERLVFNSASIIEPVNDLVVVQHVRSARWLLLNGYKSTVALRGSVCRSVQIALIAQLTARNGRVWIFPTHNREGWQWIQVVLNLVCQLRFAIWVRTEKDSPQHCTASDLAKLLWRITP